MRLIPAAAAILLLAGCVERLVAVRTEPPGAGVYFEDEQVGTTPCEVPYTWYGTREVSVRLKGFAPVRETVPLRPPWWQYPPLDLVTDVILPFTLTDRVELRYVLEPAPGAGEEVRGVLERAAELRRRAAEPE